MNKISFAFSAAFGATLLGSTPAFAQLTLTLAGQEFIEYQFQVDSGSYTFGAVSEDGDPDIAIRYLDDGQYLAVSAGTGNEEFSVDLPAATYVIRVEMYSCFNPLALFGLGTCQTALYLEKAGDEDFATEVSFYNGGSLNTSGNGGEYCESHEFRNAAGVCVPDPTYR